MTQNVIFKFLRIIYNMNGERLSSFVLRYNPIPFLNHLLYTLVSPVLKRKERFIITRFSTATYIFPESVTEVYQKCWKTQLCQSINSIPNVHLLGEEARVQYLLIDQVFLAV